MSEPETAAEDVLKTSRVPDQLILALLKEFDIDGSLIQRALARSGQALVQAFRPQGDVHVSLELSGEDIEDATIECHSPTGLFSLEGRNDIGKTFRMIGVSALLGFPWEENDVAVFLGGEQRYITNGRSFVEGFQTGKRIGLVKLAWEKGSLLVRADGGKLSVEIKWPSGEEKEAVFSLQDEGWNGYRSFMKSFVDAEFIPQNKNFLLRLFQQIAYSTRDRLEEVRDWLNSELGEAVEAIEELEYSEADLGDQIGELTSQIKQEKDRLREARRKTTALKRVGSAVGDDQKMSESLGECSNLAAQQSSLTQNLNDFKEAYEPIKDQFPLLEHIQQAQATLDEAWKEFGNAWRKLQSKVRTDILRQRVETVVATRNGAELKSFLEEADFGIPGFYVDLASTARKHVQVPPKVKRVFPLRVDYLDRDVETLDEAIALFDAEAMWANDFTLLKPSLRQFVEQVKHLAPDDLSQTPSELRAEAKSLDEALSQERKRLEPLLQGLAAALTSFGYKPSGGRDEIVADTSQTLKDIGDKLDQLYSELDPELSDAVDRLGGTGALPSLLQDLSSQAERFNQEEQQIAEGIELLEEEQEKLREQLRGVKETRADAERLGLIAMREALLQIQAGVTKYLRQRAEGEEYGASVLIRVAGVTYDLTAALKQAVGLALAGRCPSLYVYRDAQWKALPVTFVDYDTWAVIASDGTEEHIFQLTEESGTGRRAALTVLGMAHTDPDAGIRFLCVDEWGEVHRSLEHQTFEDLLNLPTPIVALITRPGDDSAGDFQARSIKV